MCKYRDCDFYIPIDVVKGIDHAHGDVVVMGDDEIDLYQPTSASFAHTIRHLKKIWEFVAVLKLSIGRLPRMELAIARHSKWQQRPLRLKPY